MGIPSGEGRLEIRERLQLGSFVVICTIVLVAVFLGIGALVEGVGGFDDRIPFYVLTMALTFFGAVVAFEAEFENPLASLPWATAVGIGTFVLVLLAGEGAAYVVGNPGRLVLIEVGFYLLAATLAGCAIGYWAFRNWETLSPTRPGL